MKIEIESIRHLPDQYRLKIEASRLDDEYTLAAMAEMVAEVTHNQVLVNGAGDTSRRAETMTAIGQLAAIGEVLSELFRRAMNYPR